jgi:hypothetical protein
MPSSYVERKGPVGQGRAPSRRIWPAAAQVEPPPQATPLLLQRLGRERQAPGDLRVEALGEFSMRPLPIDEPRLEA